MNPLEGLIELCVALAVAALFAFLLFGPAGLVILITLAYFASRA